ncbi:hypothetical protein HZH66_014263 [Vespula vulgaris]|uniref:Uncharacterized protein n=1 Tax=Vespula vulgaris TaxID=7454 RepID=A0A834J3K7_VESVU|nr:hypothetical protein HZH66_014263 [Vespula vulgaris]
MGNSKSSPSGIFWFNIKYVDSSSVKQQWRTKRRAFEIVTKLLTCISKKKIEKATVVNLEDIPVPMAINVPPISHLLIDAMDDFSDNDLGDDPVI